MFGLQALDIGLVLIFVYLLLSLICTAANEFLASVLTLRANTLAAGITNLLRDPEFEQKFYRHPLVKSLHREGAKPSYIPSRSFALVMVNVIAEASGPRRIKDIRTCD